MYTGELGKLSSNQILLTYNVTSASVQPVQHLGKTNFGFGGSGLESAPTNEYKLDFEIKKKLLLISVKGENLRKISESYDNQDLYGVIFLDL